MFRGQWSISIWSRISGKAQLYKTFHKTAGKDRISIDNTITRRKHDDGRHHFKHKREHTVFTVT